MKDEKLSHIMEISENNKNLADLANWAEPFWKRSAFALKKIRPIPKISENNKKRAEMLEPRFGF